MDAGSTAIVDDACGGAWTPDDVLFADCANAGVAEPRTMANATMLRVNEVMIISPSKRNLYLSGVRDGMRQRHALDHEHSEQGETIDDEEASIEASLGVEGSSND